MIVRLVMYGAESLDGIREWIAARSSELSDVHGLKQVHFIRQGNPPQAGALMYFESPDDLLRYKTSRRYKQLLESIEESWGDGTGPVQESVYRVVEEASEPDTVASEGTP